MGSLDDKTVPVGSLQALGQQQPRVSLLLYHAAGMEAVSLAQGQTLVVGRTPPADVSIPDPSLSRRHARFEWKDDQLWVEDLGSTNGTRLNGEAVEQAEIKASDEVTLGQVVISVHALTGPVQGVEGRHRFSARLQEAVEQARFFERKLALLLCRGAGAAPPPLRRWSTKVQALIRPVDRVGQLDAQTLAVLMPEADAEQALRVGQAAVKAGGDDLALRVGVTCFPADGGSAAKLIEVGRLALEQADEATPVQHASALQDPARWLQRQPGAGPVDTAAGGAVIHDPTMQQLFSLVERLGRSDIPVLIIGETGTGKEVVAQAIHEGGDRSGGPLRCVNCAAIPDQLLESVLFGHEKGAFTGATARSKGVFEEADGGTVMLDEVGELAPPAQAALLRVLETKQISRVGTSKEVAVDVRVVAATHRDLEAMCDAGTFRWDLLYRLNTMVLRVPPLRERPVEIEPLARHFLAAATADGRSPVRALSDEALELLATYHWPGNVRELRNEIERATVVCTGEAVGPEDLSPRLQPEQGSVVAAAAQVTDEVGEELEASMKDQVAQLEERLIRAALTRSGWNQAAAARDLKIPVRTLTNKLKAYNLRRR